MAHMDSQSPFRPRRFFERAAILYTKTNEKFRRLVKNIKDRHETVLWDNMEISLHGIGQKGSRARTEDTQLTPREKR